MKKSLLALWNFITSRGGDKREASNEDSNYDLIFGLHDLYKRSLNTALQDLQTKASDCRIQTMMESPTLQNNIKNLSRSYISLERFLEYGRVYCNISQSDYERNRQTIKNITKFFPDFGSQEMAMPQKLKTPQLSPNEIKCSPELLALIGPDKAIGDIIEFKETVSKFRKKWLSENKNGLVEGESGPACYSIPQFVGFLRASLDTTIGYLRDLGVNNSRPLSNGSLQEGIFFEIDGAPKEVGAPSFSWVLNGAEKILAFARAHGVLNQEESDRYAQLIVTTAVQNIEKRVNGYIKGLDQLNFKTASPEDIIARYIAINDSTFAFEATPQIGSDYTKNQRALRGKVVAATEGCISARLSEIEKSTGRLQTDRTENRFLLETKQMLNLIAELIEFFPLFYNGHVVDENSKSNTLKSLRSCVADRLQLASEMGSEGLALEVLEKLSDDLLVPSEARSWPSKVYYAKLHEVDIGLSPLQRSFFDAGIARPFPPMEQGPDNPVLPKAAGQTVPGWCP